MRSAQVAPFALILALFGCAASVEGSVNTGNKAEVADFDKPMEAMAVAPSAEVAPADLALLGARQDLSYVGPATVMCKCLAVALGQPGDHAFHWAGKVPKTSSDNQLVVAVSSQGVACPGATDAPGASYWGYESVGKDVVVVVEAASPGRPVATGAIIPRPLGGGQVYVRPSDKRLPYGHPATGLGDRCQIGTLASPSGTKPAPGSMDSTGSPANSDPFASKSLSKDSPNSL